MKDILTDIVAHTQSLAFLTMLKVSSSDDTTLIESMSDDKTVIFKAKTYAKIEEFNDTFGMSDLPTLALYLKNPEYAKNAQITVITEVRNGITMPTHIHFENETGDFHNDYRFMGKSIIEEKLKNVKSKISSWDVVFEPSVAAINRLKIMAGTLDAKDHLFEVKTEKNNLNFYFGDANTHAGMFTFQHDVKGTLKHTWSWSVDHLQKILNLDGDKTISITDQGAMMITVDSGLANYEYILPAQSK
jgi:hypothetical protein